MAALQRAGVIDHADQIIGGGLRVRGQIEAYEVAKIQILHLKVDKRGDFLFPSSFKGEPVLEGKNEMQLARLEMAPLNT